MRHRRRAERGVVEGVQGCAPSHKTLVSVPKISLGAF